MAYQTTKVAAAAVWYSGVAALTLKGGHLLHQASLLSPARRWIWLAVAAALLTGALKARLILVPSCRRNLKRIAALESPRAWQCFRPGFFLFLSLMISAGVILSHLAQGSFAFLVSVAWLDLTIGSALFMSSYLYWK